ncbi:MAG: hypothetical protein K0R93_2762 [Anaerosolibacter sp.]|jgi:outer membrane murein-binding lipoprotein Lpp|uniref:hypothetical protein n=1 Tax=Anaerosolibacter sp. TaxID=1872527 RepID=UPI0026136912|nr:hypothetical protein [Anaerosolibacter sp.]MDF2547864.1 hypothetical protein [Anaerosolibacter sp.]
MIENLNREILEAKKKMLEKERTQRLLVKAKQQLKNEHVKKEELYEKFMRERKDVEVLEGITLASLFATILGTKEEKLDKERQELLSAKLKYDEATKGVTQLEKEIYALEQQVEAFRNPELEYERLIEHKTDYLKGNKDYDMRTFMWEAEKSQAEHTIKELQEAGLAGTELLDSLQKAKNELESASGWGTWDMLGGGLIATMAKHSKIDEAKATMGNAQILAKRFERELSDVGENMAFDIEIGAFATFADYFFDGLIADWIVQDRIHESRSRVEQLASKVTLLLSKISRGIEDMQKKIEGIDEEMKKFIEGMA